MHNLYLNKYAFAAQLKDKIGITIINAFKNILNGSKRKRQINQ